MDPLAWSAILMAFGLLLVLLEVFVPSGGVLGFLSISSLMAAVVLAFYHRGLEAGLIFLAVAAVGVPVTLVAAFHFWPHTPMGKRLLLSIPTSEEVLPDTPLRRELRELVGKVGTAKTVMLPSGAITVAGKTIDALSAGMPIEPGQRVRVIEVRGNRVVVLPVSEDSQSQGEKDDILSQSIESLGLNPFDEPLS
jgi:membrane-bound ClpP family serine protease